MNNKAVIYARLSRKDEEKIDKNKDSKSIENQIKTLNDFANTQGFIVKRIYTDDGYSGGNFNRPAFQQMMEDMKYNKFSILLIKDLSRLGRSLHRVGDLIENVFPLNGIRVISLNDSYDSSFYKDDTSIVLKSFLNDYYLKEFRKKCKKAREHYIKTKHLNYYPKYGYRFNEKGEEIIDTYSASIVKKIYLYITEYSFSCGRVADILNTESVMTRSSYATQVLGLKPLHKQCASKWSAEKVWSIATDYEYCGHSINLVRHKKDERILIKNTHQAIISEEIYETAQLKIEKNSKVKKRLEHLGSYIIDIRSKKNLLFSKKQQIYFLREKNKKLYSISKDAIETVLFLEVSLIIEEWVKKHIKNQKEEYTGSSQKLLAELNSRYLQLLDLYFENKIDEILFLKKQKTLLDSINKIENRKEESVFEKSIDILSKLKKYKLKVVKMAIKCCYILEKEADNLIVKIVFA